MGLANLIGNAPTNDLSFIKLIVLGSNGSNNYNPTYARFTAFTSDLNTEPALPYDNTAGTKQFDDLQFEQINYTGHSPGYKVVSLTGGTYRIRHFHRKGTGRSYVYTDIEKTVGPNEEVYSISQLEPGNGNGVVDIYY